MRPACTWGRGASTCALPWLPLRQLIAELKQLEEEETALDEQLKQLSVSAVAALESSRHTLTTLATEAFSAEVRTHS